MPVLGATGMLGEATRDLYNTDLAFAFIEMLMEVKYITLMMVAVHIVALVCLWTRREALGAALVLPITANVVGFHAFIDAGLFTAGASLGNLMLIINLYLIYVNRRAFKSLIEPR